MGKEVSGVTGVKELNFNSDDWKAAGTTAAIVAGAALTGGASIPATAGYAGAAGITAGALSRSQQLAAKEAARRSSEQAELLLPEGPLLPSFSFDMPSLEIPDIDLSTPSEVGRLDVLGVRTKKNRGTGALRNQRTLTASQLGSIRSAASRAGLNLPT